MIVNKRVLSEVVGFSQQALDKWQKAGMPIKTKAIRGGENEYETADIIRWMIQRELSKNSSVTPKDRLDTLRADEIEMRLAKEAAQLIDATEAEQLWTALVTSARLELKNFADDIKAKLRTHNIDADEFEIDKSLNTILDRLAAQEIEDGDESEFIESISDDTDE